MGLFDELGAGLKGAISQAASGAFTQIETNVLPQFLNQVVGGTQLGDVSGLVEKLRTGGLGPQVASWLGNGTNMPITADQVREALGNSTVQQMAQSMGLPVDKLLPLLAQHLPAAVDHMSPDGTLQEPST
ncbi:MAG TPA: YidB family protein [Pseudolabrys sp.]|jgi:uncharacterized protein YidB (DUF937 family)